MTAQLPKNDDGQYGGAVVRIPQYKLTRNLGRKTDRSCKICCFDSCDTLRDQIVSEHLLKDEVDELAVHPP